MLEQVGSSSRASENPFLPLLKSTVLLRIGAGLVLMFRHAWEGVFQAYRFLWEEIPWDWVRLLETHGVPFPHLTAPALAALLFAVALAWIAGFLTRLFALLMLVLCGLALTLAGGEHPSFSEISWLYALIAFTLLLYGSGAISLDQLFRWGSHRPPPRSRLKRY
jgi:uncharacterized membrane protein YphA (DoxX/SURF4 family)